MFSLFSKNSKTTGFQGWGIKTDVHSHLIPGIDDGSKSMEETISMLQGFAENGVAKVITTPHIYSDFYPNTEQSITQGLEKVKDATKNQSEFQIEIEAAAEYFLDESFIEKIRNEDNLLTFGSNYLLFELSFMNEPMYLKEAIFDMQSKGIKPVLAHPERYLFFQQNWDLVEEIHARGIVFQLNLLSLTGYYSKACLDLAKKLIKNDMIRMVGSDCHNLEQLQLLSKMGDNKQLNKVLDSDLINYKL